MTDKREHDPTRERPERFAAAVRAHCGRNCIYPECDQCPRFIAGVRAAILAWDAPLPEPPA